LNFHHDLKIRHSSGKNGDYFIRDKILFSDMSLNCVRIRNILIITVILVLSIPVIVTADSHQFNFINNCNQPVWVNVQGGPPGTCDVPPAQNIDPSTGTNLKCTACSLCPDGSLCNTSVSTGASLPMCCPLITDPPVCWGGDTCSKGGCCPGLVPQTANQTYPCPGVSTPDDKYCGNTSLTLEQIEALSGYNNPSSGKHPAVCNGSIIGGGGFKLEVNGGTEFYSVDDGWQGGWFGRTNCSFTGDLGSCETGNCEASDGWGHLQCSGVGSTSPASKGEMTMDLTTGNDFYDVSLVGGYNLPMQITPRDYNPAYVNADPTDHFRCTSPGCLNSSALSSCPADLTYLPNGNLVGCQDDCSVATIYHNASPYYFTQAQVDAYCCPDTTYCSPLNPCGAGSTCAAWLTNQSTCLNCDAYNGIYPNGYPVILPNSALYFHATFPNAYSFTYDDASASYTCNSTPSTGLRTKYDITFCAQSSAPVAAFTGSPTSGTAPLTVTFTDSSTGSPTSWSWNFGDSSLENATMQNPVHTYASASTYTVSLNVTNSAGSNTVTRTNYITVNAVSGVDNVGVFRNGVFYLNDNTQSYIVYGSPTDTPVIGDWDKNGISDVGVWRSSTTAFYLMNPDGTTTTIVYGSPTDTPIIGDWNGDLISDVGVWRSSATAFYLRNTDGSTTTVVYGLPTDIPVIGDWNGDLISEVGVFRNGVFYLNGAGYTVYGAAGDEPIIGDWNGDLISEVGVWRNSAGSVFYRNGATTIAYGLPTDTPVIGKWT